MDFRILDAATVEGLDAWKSLWQAWPGREVMAHPEYARLFSRECDRVVCAAGEDDGGWVLFPLILRPLAAEPWACSGEDRWDAVSPYGYGGPFAWGPGPRDDAAYWRAYADWCRQAGVVSTFARLSLFPQQLAPLPGPAVAVAPNVVIPLTRDLDALWRAYESNVRRWVQRAERAGLMVEIDREGARLDAFSSIYTHTMRRHSADAFYFFPRTFFASIAERLAGHFAFFHALSRGEVVSSDLVLLSADRGYFYLGGTLEEALRLGANYLIKHHAASWVLRQGRKALVLGGGHPQSEGLLRYKRAFAPSGEVPFQVACLVHDDAAYAELTAERTAFESRGGKSWCPRAGFFPAYRA